MNPGGSFLLDPALEEWMARKHLINQAKIQVQRIKLSYGVNPCEVRAFILPELLEPTAVTDVFRILPSLLFSSLSRWGCGCLSQAGQTACRGLGMEEGRGTKGRGRRWGSGLRRGAHPAPQPGNYIYLGDVRVCNGVAWIYSPPSMQGLRACA